LKSSFPNQRIRKGTSRIKITATTTANNKENRELLIAASCSPVASTAFPVPAVSLDDASLQSIEIPPVKGRLLRLAD
jgi:hypothetical protein